MNLFKHTRSGDIYELVTVAKHTETDEEFVIYKNFAKSDADVIRTWARPINNFYGTVDGGKVRFEPIDNSNINEIFTESEINDMRVAIKTGRCLDATVMYNADFFQKYLER